MSVLSTIATDGFGGCDVPEEYTSVSSAARELRIVTTRTNVSNALINRRKWEDLLSHAYIQHLISMRLKLLHQLTSFDAPFRAAGRWEWVVEANCLVAGASEDVRSW